MNWIRFALYLSAIYLTYYGSLIFWEYIRNRKLPNEENAHQLFFEEDVTPVSETPDNEHQAYNTSVSSSGGVSLKQLFILARADAIEYTRPVSY